MVKRQDANRVKALGKNNQGRIGDADLLIGILLNDRATLSEIVDVKLRQLVGPRSEFFEDCQLRVNAEACCYQVVELRDDVRRNHERFIRDQAERFNHGLMVRLC